VCAEFRRNASSKVVSYFIKTGLLAEAPAL
jgi:hypothetical protein